MYHESTWKVVNVGRGRDAGRVDLKRLHAMRTHVVYGGFGDDVDLSEGDVIRACIENHTRDDNSWVCEEFMGFPFEEDRND